MLAFAAMAALPLIKIPVLDIGGEQDPFTKTQVSRTIAEEVASAMLVVINPAMEIGLIEYYKEFARQTADFCLAQNHSDDRA